MANRLRFSTTGLHFYRFNQSVHDAGRLEKDVIALSYTKVVAVLGCIFVGFVTGYIAFHPDGQQLIGMMSATGAMLQAFFVALAFIYARQQLAFYREAERRKETFAYFRDYDLRIDSAFHYLSPESTTKENANRLGRLLTAGTPDEKRKLLNALRAVYNHFDCAALLMKHESIEKTLYLDAMCRVYLESYHYIGVGARHGAKFDLDNMSLHVIDAQRLYRGNDAMLKDDHAVLYSKATVNTSPPKKATIVVRGIFPQKWVSPLLIGIGVAIVLAYAFFCIRGLPADLTIAFGVFIIAYFTLATGLNPPVRVYREYEYVALQNMNLALYMKTVNQRRLDEGWEVFSADATGVVYRK